jgi:hypothetical protein
LGFELWIGDPAEIKGKRVKKRKLDREDARLLLRPLRENNFPQIWVPDAESGSATTAVAPPSVGADAHPDHESAACASDERGLLLEEETIQRKRTSGVRETLVGTLGQSPPARVVGVVRPYESDYRHSPAFSWKEF